MIFINTNLVINYYLNSKEFETLSGNLIKVIIKTVFIGIY